MSYADWFSLYVQLSRPWIRNGYNFDTFSPSQFSSVPPVFSASSSTSGDTRAWKMKSVSSFEFLLLDGKSEKMLEEIVLPKM